MEQQHGVAHSIDPYAKKEWYYTKYKRDLQLKCLSLYIYQIYQLFDLLANYFKPLFNNDFIKKLTSVIGC